MKQTVAAHSGCYHRVWFTMHAFRLILASALSGWMGCARWVVPDDGGDAATADAPFERDVSIVPTPHGRVSLDTIPDVGVTRYSAAFGINAGDISPGFPCQSGFRCESQIIDGCAVSRWSRDATVTDTPGISAGELSITGVRDRTVDFQLDVMNHYSTPQDDFVVPWQNGAVAHVAATGSAGGAPAFSVDLPLPGAGVLLTPAGLDVNTPFVVARTGAADVSWHFDGPSFGATLSFFQTDNLNQTILWTICEVAAPRTDWSISQRIVAMYTLANTGLLTVYETSRVLTTVGEWSLNIEARREIAEGGVRFH